MIRFNFSIANPFKHAQWGNIWQKEIQVAKYKTLEIQFYKYAWDLFSFELDLRYKGSDHAGPRLEINLFGWTGSIAIVDHRHWDHDNHTWHHESATLD